MEDHPSSTVLVEMARQTWVDSDRINIIEKHSGQGLALAVQILNDQLDKALFVHLGDVRDADDLLLCLSEALPGPTWGQGIQTQAQLSQFKGIVVLYGSDRSTLSGLEMMTFKASHKWILISNQSLNLQPSMTIECPSKQIPPNEPTSLNGTSKAMAYLPAGLPNGNQLPSSIRLPWPNQKEVMGWDYAQRVKEKISPSESVSLVAAALDETLNAAENGIMPIQEEVNKLFALRWISEASAIPEQSLRAAISYARLRTVLGQPEKALSALDAARNRDPDMPPRLSVMLNWSASQAHAHMGDQRLMKRTADTALNTAKSVDDAPSEVMILRTRAETRRLWGDYSGAHMDYRNALLRADDAGLESARPAILRGLSELAIADNALFKAASLLEQAQTNCSSTIEEINRQLTKSGIRLQSGDLDGTAELLKLIADKVKDWPILHANFNRRKSELALANKKRNDALSYAEKALQGYRKAGMRREASATLRLTADITAVLGEKRDALILYRQCLTDQAAIGDGNGLQKTLDHLLEILKAGKQKRELKAISERFNQFDFGELTHNTINWRFSDSLE